MSKVSERYYEAIKNDERFVDPEAEAAELELRIQHVRDHIKSAVYTGANYEVVEAILGEDLK
ncbi:hypothetical protein DLP3_100 [Stenotrophomonas phage vB_SmaS_DLP_3]|nr:hypothetical protein DLP3_100 [Stenotrophomonas phage vB_SmaS_DLP_3]